MGRVFGATVEDAHSVGIPGPRYRCDHEGVFALRMKMLMISMEGVARLMATKEVPAHIGY